MFRRILTLAILFIFVFGQDKTCIVDIKQYVHQSKASFRGLSILDSENIWVSGSNGTVIKTTDSGISWSNVSPKNFSTTGFRDIHAFTSSSAIIMGIATPAYFLKTTDSGKTWQQVYTNSEEKIFFDSFEFLNTGFGIAMSDPIKNRFYLITTTNYGETWAQVDTNQIPVSISEGGFAASGSCIAFASEKKLCFVSGGRKARVYFSFDAAQSWQVANTPMYQGKATRGIYSIAFRDSLFGVAVGGDYTQISKKYINAIYTNNSGKTWNQCKELPFGFKSSIAFSPIDASFAICAGTSGIDISNDSGLHWIHYSDVSLNAIGFDNLGQIWGVGDKGLIVKMEVKY